MGTREAAVDLLDEQAVPRDLRHADVIVFCDDLATGSASFADELVRQVLAERHGGHLVLVGAPQLFWARVCESAERRGVPHRVTQKSAAEVTR
ncbi:hypothetical protein [Modestobacter altitudinis]|uniref:hypothetical protein n=1 Tax=Modestobacter altitudinis TaxID=2213158 RepID=UPI00110C9706|nr:hypothetical protein [Modestobacter altitudinis]